MANMQAQALTGKKRQWRGSVCVWELGHWGELARLAFFNWPECGRQQANQSHPSMAVANRSSISVHPVFQRRLNLLLVLERSRYGVLISFQTKHVLYSSAIAASAGPLGLLSRDASPHLCFNLNNRMAIKPLPVSFLFVLPLYTVRLV